MLNYIKSEWYRIVHEKEIYVITIALSVLVVVMNAVLFICNKVWTDFQYGTIKFSFNVLIGGLNYLMISGLLIVSFLFAEKRKNGVLKNEIAYGISRTSIFVGDCFVSILASILSMIVILVFYIGSAFLFLEGPGEIPLTKLFEGVGAALPSAFAAVLLAVALFHICENDVMAIFSWFAIMFVIPTIIFYIGLKVSALAKVAAWMPWNFFNHEVVANMGDYFCLWNTPQGLTKCIVSGLIGIIAFGVWGNLGIRKKEF